MPTCKKYVLFLLLISAFAQSPSSAQDVDKPQNKSDDVVKLHLFPCPVPELTTSVRLMPSEFDLKPGNAAVVLLRMPWEQTKFMSQVMPKVNELIELEYDDPSIASEFSKHFGHFRKQIHRAAYMRDADWNYPIGEEPMMGILLPDVQGMREFILRGMNLWIGTQIVEGKLDLAREGILDQLACARHVCRTPFAVCQLVGGAIADGSLQRFEILIQQPAAKNHYYALAMLPHSLGDYHAVFEFEARALPETLPSLTDPFPPVGDVAWKKIADEFVDFVNGFGLQMKENDLLELKARLLNCANDELSAIYQISQEEIETMSDEEKVMRLVLGKSRKFTSQAHVSALMPFPEAIKELEKLQRQIDEFKSRLDLPKELSSFVFTFLGPDAFVAMNRFGRRVKLLQVVEALRDHASRHDGKLPNTLTEIELFVPNDPMTGNPFVYELKGETGATLSAEEFSELDYFGSKMPIYHILMHQGEK